MLRKTERQQKSRLCLSSSVIISTAETLDDADDATSADQDLARLDMPYDMGTGA